MHMHTVDGCALADFCDGILTPSVYDSPTGIGACSCCFVRACTGRRGGKLQVQAVRPPGMIVNNTPHAQPMNYKTQVSVRNRTCTAGCFGTEANLTCLPPCSQVWCLDRFDTCKECTKATKTTPAVLAVSGADVMAFDRGLSLELSRKLATADIQVHREIVCVCVRPCVRACVRVCGGGSRADMCVRTHDNRWRLAQTCVRLLQLSPRTLGR